MNAKEILDELKKAGDPEDARFLQRFFKTGEGEYGFGDVFLGIRVPATRNIAKKRINTPLPVIENILESEYHEARLLGLLIMVLKRPKAAPEERTAFYELYLRRHDRINNWDLVDVTCPHLVGLHLLDKSKATLDRLSRSKNLWERRTAIVATHAFIRAGRLDDTFRIAEKLLHDHEDLIHKATGWMLREAGKKDLRRLIGFLDQYAGTMPRMMLRYAIEKLPEIQRKGYLGKKRSGSAVGGIYAAREYD
jgi:3-methyladenine DNA glycosylase AlkD